MYKVVTLKNCKMAKRQASMFAFMSNPAKIKKTGDHNTSQSRDTERQSTDEKKNQTNERTTSKKFPVMGKSG